MNYKNHIEAAQFGLQYYNYSSMTIFRYTGKETIIRRGVVPTLPVHHQLLYRQRSSSIPYDATHLVKGVGPGSPPGHEHAQSHRLKDLGRDAHTDGIKRPPLREELHQEPGRGGGSKDQTAEVRSALVAQGAGGVDESTHTVGLERGADEGGAPGDGGGGRLLGLDELLLGVGELGAVVGLAEERREDRELDAVVEEGAQGNGRGLDGREVWERGVSFLVSFILKSHCLSSGSIVSLEGFIALIGRMRRSAGESRVSLQCRLIMAV